MKIVTYKETAADYLLDGNIDNNDFPGFKEDYRVIHCLIRQYKPKSLFEIGTNMGTGTNILCNANRDMKVYSLDLPTEQAHKSLQHPISEGKGDKVGSACKYPFTQLRGDSLTFDYSKHPCEAYYVDGEHDFEHPHHETRQIVKNKPTLIMWHDTDIPHVLDAIKQALTEDYILYRVIDTRISYALRADSH